MRGDANAPAGITADQLCNNLRFSLGEPKSLSAARQWQKLLEGRAGLNPVRLFQL